MHNTLGDFWFSIVYNRIAKSLWFGLYGIILLFIAIRLVVVLFPMACGIVLFFIGYVIIYLSKALDVKDYIVHFLF
jgi:hypothetical protein